MRATGQFEQSIASASLALSFNNPCRHPNRCSSCGHIARYDRIGTNNCVIANRDTTQNLGPSTHIDVTTNARNSARRVPYGYLLEEQAVGTDLRLWMDDDAIWMRDHQSAPNL